MKTFMPINRILGASLGTYRMTNHESRLTNHESGLTNHRSRITNHPLRLLQCIVAVAITCASAALAATSAWKPERAVEFVIPATSGGGQDRTARIIQKILQDEVALGVPINIVNKGGGGGNIAYSYLQQFKGDGHYIATATPSLVTNSILGVSPISHTDFTPVSVLYSEYIGFAVQAEGPIKTGADLLQRL